MDKTRDALATYQRKRDFAKTPEPSEGGAATGATRLSFVVQKHHASHLHYDFRLELDGTLKSWAVPKGPCLDPTVKRMAVEVEDHPISYADFEGTIPAGNYGAGRVIVWDRGEWEPVGDPRQGLAKGDLKFNLFGHKLRGRWVLVRMHRKGEQEKKPAWLLIKERDGEVRPLSDYDVTEAMPDSVLGLGDAPAAKPGKARKSAAAGEVVEPKPPPKAALPANLVPQLATLAEGPPRDPEDWLYELKFDGYRLLARIEGKEVRCFTRNGHDWSERLPELVKALRTLELKSGWIDGEIVVEGENGTPDFQALQNAFERSSTSRIVYWMFDVPYLDGHDLRDVPFEQRSVLLRGLIGEKTAPQLRVSEAFDADPRGLLAAASKLGFEGIVGKRRDAAYVSRRSPSWIKLKATLRQEFVIGGYTAPAGARNGFGSLLLGVHDEKGALQYCGNVGTGFDEARLADIKARMDAVAAKSSPFAGPVPSTVKVAQWVKPQLVAEVSFGEWTRDGRIRHSVFQGLREDKPARQIGREQALAPDEVEDSGRPKASRKAVPGKRSEASAARGAPAGGAAPARVRVTNADRVIDKSTGITKGELVAYYQRIAPLMLPHLQGRPVSLLRAPSGIDGELFFQKHAQKREMPGVTLLPPELDRDHEPLLQIDTDAALVSAAQMNTVELHTWNATSNNIAKPERICFDLDPGEGVGWPHVQEAAMLVRALLEELGLPSLLKTSGGKGLHVVVPIKRYYEWDPVKDFSRAVVEHLAQTIPSRFVAKSGPKNRVGKIFVDYLRNGFGATTVSAWSVRSRPGMGVSVPVEWDELPQLKSGAHWTLSNFEERIAVGNSPWNEMEKMRVGLAAAMRKLGFDPSA
ncbi:DNA ligase D [Variovorax sp. OV329]|uniref:DNA ligase D n=1 Tax=Variovorax sp. OV329 TaxID=1882825 RepID=UPI0008EA2A0B|nr:DNA ligase D [Variovorax sp. OV329]SFM81825.1 ATP-dependent DNA ligase LigD phosphoesterase module /ATP-dependent DNA ligase LigD polymerase module [Variovorax sp. OV329]